MVTDGLYAHNLNFEWCTQYGNMAIQKETQYGNMVLLFASPIFANTHLLSKNLIHYFSQKYNCLEVNNLLYSFYFL
jgi:hypothetical protein